MHRAGPLSLLVITHLKFDSDKEDHLEHLWKSKA